MKKILFVVGCFFVTSTQAMEGEDKYAATVAERFDLSVPWNTLPQDVMPAPKSRQKIARDNQGRVTAAKYHIYST